MADLVKTPDKSDAPEKPSPNEQQWQLALAYLRRGEASAHALRTALFFAAIAVAALVLWQMKAGKLDQVFYVNAASVVLTVFSIFFLVKSWQLQKEKAIERFKFFQAKDADAVALYDGVTSQLKGLQSRYWDWLAFWALAAAILIQIVARTMGDVVPLIAPLMPPPPALPPINL
jgi:uncharacterized membrane protein